MLDKHSLTQNTPQLLTAAFSLAVPGAKSGNIRTIYRISSDLIPTEIITVILCLHKRYIDS